MDALDCANFGSERACRTESSPTDSTQFTAAHHAEPITAASSFTVSYDFSNKANFSNATTDAGTLSAVAIGQCSQAIRVCEHEQRGAAIVDQMAGSPRS
jgi:hypothetical protein